MAKVRLTAGRVAWFACPEGKQQAFLRDSEVPGLLLRATAAGAKAYVFEAVLSGKVIRVTIGSPASWTLDAARTEARRLRMLADQGIDPRTEREARKKAHAEARQKEAIAETPALELWRAYCKDRREAWGERHYLDHVRMADPGGTPRKRGGGVTQAGILHGLLCHPLAGITPERIEQWARAEAKARPTQARLALRLLKAFLRWCADRQELRPILEQTRPLSAAPKAREVLGQAKAKTDALQREQLAAFFKAVRALPDPAVSAYLQSLLLTGARPTELRMITWEHVDFQWRSLLLRDKVEGERIIPLTPYVGSLLAQLPRRGRYVFMTVRAKDAPMSHANHALSRVCIMAGIPPVSPHGLRRSFGTLAEWMEVPAGITAQIMGHKPSAIAEKHYRVRPLDMLRTWHERIERWILEEAGISAPAEIEGPGLRVVSS